jgi:hypothetical protein
MNYKKIEYFIRARPGRDEWTLAIAYPRNAKATEIKFSGTRDEAIALCVRRLMIG